MSLYTKIDKKIRLNQTLKLIKKTNDIYLFEMQTLKGDKKTPRTIQITTTKDLSTLLNNGNPDSNHVMRFYVEKSENDSWNDSKIWKISEEEHAVKIFIKSKNNNLAVASPKMSTPKIETRTTTTKQPANNNLSEKVDQLQTQINNLTSNLETKLVNNSFEWLEKQLDNWKHQFAKEISVLGAKISMMNDNYESQKFILLKEITILEEKIKKINSSGSFWGEPQRPRYNPHDQEQINSNNSNFHKYKQKRDWSYRGFVRKSVYCKLKNIKLLDTQSFHVENMNMYDIQVNTQGHKKSIYVCTAHKLDQTLQLHFYIHKDFEKSHIWNINDLNNNITFSVQKH